MKIYKFCFLLIALMYSLQLNSLSAQNKDSLYISGNYYKAEYRIPMRDGVKLFTIVYSPKDTSHDYPVLFNRTPYSIAPYGINDYPKSLGPSKYFAKEKYIFVYQDVRGRFMSEGKYEDVRPFIPDKKSAKEIDESSDVYDTIDWLIKNLKHSNGKVGMYGISYPGFYAAMGTINAHPALKAVSPQAPIADWFIDDDFHHHGAFWLPHAFRFYAVFGIPRDSLHKEWPKSLVNPGTEDGYNFFLNMGPFKNTNEKYFKHRIPFWDTLIAHPDYDSFWQRRNTLPYFDNIKPAVLTVGGWFDAEDLYGALNTYKAIEQKNEDNRNTIIMGPWFHGGWERSQGDHLGNINFGSETSEFYQKNIEIPFFDYYLKDKGDLNIPEAYMFETGTNVWKKYNQWPPSNIKKESIYLHENHDLSFNLPDKNENDSDSFISDPNKPVPYTQKTTYGMIREYMVEDQRFAASRPDVLVYSSNTLANNTTIAGPIIADLFVSTSGTDADWVVKIIDVFPDTAKNNNPNPCDIQMGGFQMMVRGDVMRGKYRKSYEKPEAFKPGEISEVKFTIPDINHTFLTGHKIMVQIQSTWFPLVDLNPQKFVDIYKADKTDFQKATNSIYHSKEYPSKLEVNVLE